ncbi:MAG: hypothetical protein H5U38_02280, partial [Calditrichaeota bacterium]|nr:hypothetical protein [Calditrichota bacterium]
YNVRGQLIALLCDQSQPAGRHKLVWDGRDSRGEPVGSGVYVAVLSHGGQVQRVKLLLAK